MLFRSSRVSAFDSRRVRASAAQRREVRAGCSERHGVHRLPLPGGYLAARAGDYVVGTTIAVDGGIVYANAGIKGDGWD